MSLPKRNFGIPFSGLGGPATPSSSAVSSGSSSSSGSPASSGSSTSSTPSSSTTTPPSGAQAAGSAAATAAASADDDDEFGDDSDLPDPWYDVPDWEGDYLMRGIRETKIMPPAPLLPLEVGSTIILRGFTYHTLCLRVERTLAQRAEESGGMEWMSAEEMANFDDAARYLHWVSLLLSPDTHLVLF
ncbi:hypothetical protein BDZ45DRAFT_48790 [Acephala macrosclerotiorum]|nr:hypothetical protein BDZ45DRAFT_48790 [Acephala macrosclerotiorum]